MNLDKGVPTDVGFYALIWKTQYGYFGIGLTQSTGVAWDSKEKVMELITQDHHKLILVTVGPNYWRYEIGGLRDYEKSYQQSEKDKYYQLAGLILD